MKTKPHQKRVVTEQSDLNEKRQKLVEFIDGPMFALIDKKERSRLNRQLASMTDYSNILAERIAAFEP